ncbi:family 20 glycosylhydrolase [Capnocytophaga canimorsus]|nr:family 20 glycosylhydrolase [Capnocytophaga canimorsus]GJQ05241.1 beta-N-acetylhexosaminidase [Capnocytophaga canimorsus]
MKHFMIIAFCLFFGISTAQNTKPFVIPELSQWQQGKGNFTISEKTSISADMKSAEVAQAFTDDFKTMFGKNLKINNSKSDIHFEIHSDILKDKGEEAYQIEIGQQVKVSANSTKGLYWATRTLLQLSEQSFDLPCGTIIDYPQYPLRGFMLDVGRKFFTIDYLKSVVKLMAYYKMNTFQIHLNDNGFKKFFNEDWGKTYSAFRLESTTFPGLAAKDGHYTKDEFRQLQIDALKQGVTIIPEIDAPAHTLAFAHYLPEIGSDKYGKDHVDLFNPKTYEFLNQLFKEYLEGENPVFVNPLVHIGTDEYNNEDPEVVEKFRYFTDYYIKYIESFGKKAALWGALTHAKGKTPVKVEDVLMFCWYNGYAEPRDMIALGYDVVSIPDGLVYIVPQAGYYYDYLNIKKLYESWTPATIGKEVFEENHPQIKGGMFAVWNDHCGNGISQQDVYHRVFPAMQTLSVKMWNGKNTTLPFADFDKKRLLLSEAPAVNVLGRPEKNEKGVVFEIKNPEKGKELGQKLTDIGYDYRVTFYINAKSNPKGTALFTSDYATFYLSDPKSGKVGFSRDGYDYQFNYFLPTNKKLKIIVKGTNKSTSLYVNDELIETLEIVPHKDDAHLDKPRKWVQTLVFPLKKLEHFNGKITDLKVEYLKD